MPPYTNIKHFCVNALMKVTNCLYKALIIFNKIDTKHYQPLFYNNVTKRCTRSQIMAFFWPLMYIIIPAACIFVMAVKVATRFF